MSSAGCASEATAQAHLQAVWLEMISNNLAEYRTMLRISRLNNEVLRVTPITSMQAPAWGSVITRYG